MIPEISAALASIKFAREMAGFYRGVEKTIDQAEFKLKIADIVDALTDAREKIADVQGLVIEKDERIRGLEEALKFQGELQYEEPVYWQYKDGAKIDGPFCPKCWDDERKTIRTQKTSSIRWGCPKCKIGFNNRDYKPAARGT